MRMHERQIRRENPIKKPLFIAAASILILGAIAAWRRFRGLNVVVVSHDERRASPTNLKKRREKPQGLGHEPFHIPIFGVTVVLLMSVIAAIILQGALWDWVKRVPHAATAEVKGSSSLETRPGKPALRVDSKENLASYMAAEQAKLHRYEWMDQKRGIARVPIEIAMQAIVEQGILAHRTNTSVSSLELQRLRATGNSTK